MALGLNNLRKRAGIDRKALGRGIGSGCGKTSSYGHKGAKARSGRGTVSWFEGGQMPFHRRMPKRGFRSMADKSIYGFVNLCDLQRLCDAEKLSAGQDVDLALLQSVGAVRQSVRVLKILGKGELSCALKIKAHQISDGVQKRIESVGGCVELIG